MLTGCGVVLVLLICAVGAFLALRQLRGVSPIRALDVTRESADGGIEATVDPQETPDSVDAPTLGGRIAFVDGEGALASIAPDGQSRQELEGEETMTFLFPAWSPDGSRIAALGAGASGSGVYVFDDSDGGQPDEVYVSGNRAPIYLYWRPDGDAVSFIASGESGLDLFLGPISAAVDEPQLLMQGQPLYWDWLDEQARLIVHTGTPVSEGRITLVDAGKASDAQDLESDAADPGFFQAPGVSVGGQFAAYGEVDGTRRWLTVRDLQSQEQFRTAHAGAVALGWSPKEQQVAFISPSQQLQRRSETYYGPLRLLDATTQDVTTLVNEQVLAFFWAPDGRSIAYFTLAAGMGEQVAEGGRDAGRAQVRSKAGRQHEDVRLTLSIVRIGGGEPQRIVDFRPPDVFLTQFLPFFDQYALSHRLWSPDSTALVLPIVEDERSRLYIVPATGRGLRLLTDGEMGFWSPR